MIKIIDIKKLKGDKYLVEIEKKGTKIPHIITENTIIKHNLLKQRPLSIAEYKTIVVDNEYETLYLKSLNYISYQMRTISEVRKHLKKDTSNEKLIDRIVDELKKNNYLSDTNYVKEYVSEKLEFDLVGPKYIKDKLVQKGIHFDLISNELLRFTENMEYDKIFVVIDKEIKYKLKKNYQKAYISLKQKLVTKGFNIAIIESSLQSKKDDIKAMIDEDDLLQKELSKLKGKYDLSNYEEKQKLIKKLMIKGYAYGEIKKQL